MANDGRGSVIVGAYEHPARELPGYTVPRVLYEVTLGALADAGISSEEIDGFFCDSSVPGFGPLDMAGYLGLQVRYVEANEVGGATYASAVGHADAAIRAGKCRVALVVLGGLPRSLPGGMSGRAVEPGPAAPYNYAGSHPLVADYALAATRHMHEFGTTSEQLAWVKVAAAQHAQHNPQAFLRSLVTVEEVLASPMIADPLHRLDSCVVTDGGGALLVVHPDVAVALGRSGARVLGFGEADKSTDSGPVDLTFTAARSSGARAFEDAGVNVADVRYASLYDSYTITVLLQLEDLGFCAPGAGGRFVEDGGLVARTGHLAVNTDGGGLCNNHPGNRGGMTKVIEAVRQLRGEATPAVQVENCGLALVSAIGGLLSTRHHASTLILESTRT